MKIKKIEITGNLSVSGIYNSNGKGLYKGNENHIKAKQDRNGRDFTSRNCLRYELFKDLQPRQPTGAELAVHFVPMASSLVGLLRGYISTRDDLKRFSPLHVADAYTSDEEIERLKGYSSKQFEQDDQARKVLFVEQLSNSKPKETDLKSTSKHKVGEDANDTTIFTRENAPQRIQNFRAVVSIKELQFLPLDDGYYRMVAKSSESEFVDGLKRVFQELQNDDSIQIRNYIDANAVMPFKRRGILLSNAQQAVLLKNLSDRIITLNGYKSGASLEFVPDSFNCKISDNDLIPNEIGNYKQTIQSLPTWAFESFYVQE